MSESAGYINSNENSQKHGFIAIFSRFALLVLLKRLLRLGNVVALLVLLFLVRHISIGHI